MHSKGAGIYQNTIYKKVGRIIEVAVGAVLAATPLEFADTLEFAAKAAPTVMHISWRIDNFLLPQLPGTSKQSG